MQMQVHDPPEQSEEKWLVFISHAGTDTWVAKQISKEIEACGAKTFLDEVNISVGEDFEDSILRALDQANELLVLLTPWSLKRPYVWAEIGAAWIKRMPVIGVLHGLTPEELNVQSGIPLILKRRDLINLNDLDQYLSELAERVGKERGE
jgi:TIR domain-containing protein